MSGLLQTQPTKTKVLLVVSCETGAKCMLHMLLTLCLPEADMTNSYFCGTVTFKTSPIWQQWCTINLIWVNRNKTLRESVLTDVGNVVSIPNLPSVSFCKCKVLLWTPFLSP